MKKKKKIILTTIVIGTLLTASLVPVFLLRKGSDDNQETDQKTVDNYVEKLKKLTPKEVTIKETSGSVTKNKNGILSAIKNLDKFPSIPNGVTLEVKDDSKNLTLQGTAITLVVKKLTITKEVSGFKAKRSQSSQEIDQENVNGFVEKLKALVTKEVTISQTSGSVTDNKDSIKSSIETLANFPVVPSGVTWEVKEKATALTTAGVNITLTVSKGLVSQDVTGFKAKRSQSSQEIDQENVNGFVEKLNNLVTKEVTISQTSGSVTDNKDSIKSSIETLANFPVVPSGVTWEVKEEATALTTAGVNITLTISKGLVIQDVTGFSAKRSASDQEVVDGFVEKLNNLVTKEVTISQTSGSVTDNKDSIKSSIETLANFPVVPSGVTWEVKEEATALTTAGVNITLTISKGLVSQDVRGFSAKRSQSSQEIDQENINGFVEKLKALVTKEVTISQTSGSVTDNKDSIKSSIETLANFPVVPSGVTWEVKEEAIALTTAGVNITLTVSKGLVSQDVRGFSAKRSQSSQEIDQENINGFVEKLKGLVTKEVTISQTSGSVTDNKDSIKSSIETLANFPVVPSGVTWEVKEEATALTTAGVNITLTVSKGLVSQDVRGFSAKRSASDQEVVDGFVEKLKALVTKEVTISQTSGSVTDNKDSIKSSIETLANFPVVPSGVTWEVKEEATALTTAGVNITLTVSKGLVSQDVKGFSAKRSASDQEVVDGFVEKLNNLVTKEVTINQTSGSVTDNKDSIKSSIETLANFPVVPSGVTWEVKEEATALTTAGVNVTLTVSKGLVSQDVRGFSAKRSASDQEVVDGFVEKLNNLVTKEVTINQTSGSVIDNKDSIKSSIETLANFPVVPSGVTWEVKEEATALTTAGVNVTLTVSKGLVNQDVRGFSAKRTKTQFELDTASINSVKKILDDEGQKVVTIENVEAKVGASGVAAKIVEELKVIIEDNLDGVTIEIKADDNDENIVDTGDGIGFIIKLSKGTASVEISNWKVLRTKTQFELDTASINSVKKILDDEGQKVVTIENEEAKVGASGVATKIVEELKVIIEDNLDGVTIEIKADDNDENIVDTGNGIGFIIKLSKGTASVEISNWKVLRTKTQFELDTASINSVKKILDDEGQKVVTIENVEAKVGASGVAAKIVEELKVIIEDNLDGAKIEVKADDNNENIVDTGNGIGFIITLSKGTASVEISDWKVLRIKTQFELDTASINSVKKILDDEGQKVVTIENEEAKVGASGVAAKIVEELKVIIEDNLDGVTIEIKADDNDENIVDTGDGIGFIIKLSKGTASVEISDWKVLRTKTQFELDTASINSVKKILDDEGQKVVTIENVEAKVGASGVAAKIVEELKVIIEDNLDGATIEVKADDNNENIVDTGNGIGFIITLSKGTASVEISDWKVLRTKTQFELNNERVVDEFILKLNALGEKELTIFEVSSGTVNDHKDLIRSAIVNLNNFPTDLPDGLSLEVKGETTTLTAAGVDITLVVSKGLVNKEVLGFRVKLKLTGRNGVENSIRNYYVSFKGFKMEISNRVSLNDNNEIQTAVKNHIFYNVGTNKNWISIPNDVDSISLDETNPTKVIVTFSVGSINIKREFKVWKASS